MREIIFRGMGINGKWVSGNLALLDKSISVNSGSKIDAGSYISNSCGIPFAYQVRPETVGQYTGLKDKNGKMIFEGDVLYHEDTAMSGHVYFWEGAFVFGGASAKSALVNFNTPFSMKIIGNIHEQKEDV